MTFFEVRREPLWLVAVAFTKATDADITFNTDSDELHAMALKMRGWDNKVKRNLQNVNSVTYS